MAGLEEIAQAAGVSTATVSRVLNRRTGVRDETRRRVLDVLATMPYVARGLAGLERTGVIGLLVPELANPIFPAFAEALETRAARRGYSSVLCNTHSASLREEEYVRALIRRGVDAMVFVSSEAADPDADHDHYRRLLDDGVRMVFVNGSMPSLEVPGVGVDERLAGYLATRHLLELGHERVGFVSGPERSTPSRLKRAGWEAALDGAGIGARRRHVAQGAYTAQGGAKAMGRLLDLQDAGVTGVICSSDVMALGAIRECRDRGLAVPNDISVVGFDDIPLAAYLTPPLTSLAQPIAEMATAAIDILLGQVEGSLEADATTRLFRPRLIERASTAPPSGRTSSA